MARITKAIQKILGGNAPQDQIAAFGSCKTGTPVYTTDIDALQTDAYETGWQAATDNDQAPYREEMNGVQYGLSRQIAYLLQEGVAEYNEGATYYKGSIVKTLDNRNKPILYSSIVDDNTGNALSDTTKWSPVQLGGGWSPPLLQSFWSDHLIDRADMLRGDTFSWQPGTTYSAVYDYLVEQYNNAGAETTDGANVTYKRTNAGLKIALTTQEETIATKFNNDGIAWYYILDTENQRFKLPRTKFGFEGVRTAVGDDINESLPNIKGKFLSASWISKESTNPYYGGAIQNGISLGGVKEGENPISTQATFDASWSASTYQDNAPVQERATQMYLYFYVGNYTQTAVEQTAGLNAELFNAKAGVDLDNLSAVGQAILDRKVEVEALLEQNGYAKFTWKNGNKISSLIVQFGNTSQKTQVINLPTSYSNVNYNIVCGVVNGSGGMATGSKENDNTKPKTLSSFYLYSNGASGSSCTGSYWFTIGY